MSRLSQGRLVTTGDIILKRDKVHIGRRLWRRMGGSNTGLYPGDEGLSLFCFYFVIYLQFPVTAGVCMEIALLAADTWAVTASAAH